MFFLFTNSPTAQFVIGQDPLQDVRLANVGLAEGDHLIGIFAPGLQDRLRLEQHAPFTGLQRQDEGLVAAGGRDVLHRLFDRASLVIEVHVAVKQLEFLLPLIRWFAVGTGCRISAPRDNGTTNRRGRGQEFSA